MLLKFVNGSLIYASDELPGYSAPGVEKVSQHLYDSSEISKLRSKAPDAKESFECGREESKEMPNIWLPENVANDVLPGFKDTCLDFFWVRDPGDGMLVSCC